MGRFLIFAILFFTPTTKTNAWDPQNFGNLNSKIIHTYSNELKKNKGCHIESTGGSMTTDLRIASIGYQLYKTVDLANARQIFVEISSEFLRRYNADKAIRPYLHNYPFKSKNLELQLSFSQSLGIEFVNKEISYVSMVNGNIVYYINDTITNGLLKLHKETFEEALSIVHQVSIAQQKIAEGATQ